MTADLNVYIWGGRGSRSPQGLHCQLCLVIAFAAVTFFSFFNEEIIFFFYAGPLFLLSFFGTGRQSSLVNAEDWWLFLKTRIVPDYCSFVSSDKIPILRGVIKICCNSSSSHPPPSPSVINSASVEISTLC